MTQPVRRCLACLNYAKRVYKSGVIPAISGSLYPSVSLPEAIFRKHHSRTSFLLPLHLVTGQLARCQTRPKLTRPYLVTTRPEHSVISPEVTYTYIILGGHVEELVQKFC